MSRMPKTESEADPYTREADAGTGERGAPAPRCVPAGEASSALSDRSPPPPFPPRVRVHARVAGPVTEPPAPAFPLPGRETTCFHTDVGRRCPAARGGRQKGSRLPSASRSPTTGAVHVASARARRVRAGLGASGWGTRVPGPRGRPLSRDSRTQRARETRLGAPQEERGPGAHRWRARDRGATWARAAGPPRGPGRRRPRPLAQSRARRQLAGARSQAGAGPTGPRSPGSVRAARGGPWGGNGAGRRWEGLGVRPELRRSCRASEGQRTRVQVPREGLRQKSGVPRSSLRIPTMAAAAWRRDAGWEVVRERSGGLGRRCGGSGAAA